MLRDVACWILPSMISPLWGRKTRIRNSAIMRCPSVQDFIAGMHGGHTADVDLAIGSDKALSGSNQVPEANAESHLAKHLNR